MGKTYTYLDALNFVGVNFQKVLTDSYGAVLADQANSMIWNSADWRNTLAAFQPFYVSPSQQDYGAPSVQVPLDMMGLRAANLVSASASPPGVDPLNVMGALQKTDLTGLPKDISYEPSNKSFRLFPRPDAGLAPTQYFVEGTYKQAPARITPSGLGAVLPWDDAYFRVFTTCLLYCYFAATNSPQAGNVQTAKNGNAVYTGQLGAAFAALHEMAADEALNLGDVSLAPSAPLISPGLSRY